MGKYFVGSGKEKPPFKRKKPGSGRGSHLPQQAGSRTGQEIHDQVDDGKPDQSRPHSPMLTPSQAKLLYKKH